MQSNPQLIINLTCAFNLNINGIFNIYFESCHLDICCQLRLHVWNSKLMISHVPSRSVLLMKCGVKWFNKSFRSLETFWLITFCVFSVIRFDFCGKCYAIEASALSAEKKLFFSLPSHWFLFIVTSICVAQWFVFRIFFPCVDTFFSHPLPIRRLSHSINKRATEKRKSEEFSFDFLRKINLKFSKTIFWSIMFRNDVRPEMFEFGIKFCVLSVE